MTAQQLRIITERRPTDWRAWWQRLGGAALFSVKCWLAATGLLRRAAHRSHATLLGGHHFLHRRGGAADAAAAQFDATVIEALRQTAIALSAYARELDRNRGLSLVRDSAARAADQAGRLYRFGRTVLLSLLAAQAILASAEATLAASTPASRIAGSTCS